MANDSKFLIVNPDTMPGDADLCHVAKASNTHGGFTILAAHLSTGAVGTFDVVLVNFGTSGTVTAGTAAGMTAGTDTVWAVDTPQSLSLTAANAFIDSNEWLVLKKLEVGAGNDLTADATLVIEYVDGVVTQS